MAIFPHHCIPDGEEVSLGDMNMGWENIGNRLSQQQSIAPLAFFRVVFGAMMAAGTLRFAAKGWIEELYIKPQFYFPYYGFEWVKPLGDPGMYILFFVMGCAALGLMLGLFYRASAVVFFLTFTYVELIDKSNYLNHYYFVSIIALILVFLPAGRYFSLDVWRCPERKFTHIPVWITGIIRLQLGLVYFYAGIAKLNPDWLFEAKPLRIWLPAQTNLPVIGFLMDELWIAYVFSWFGAIYDISIPFLLWYRRTRLFAYATVVLFHGLTAVLFQIGMFPYVMIVSTLIFFSPDFHERVIGLLRRFLPSGKGEDEKPVFFHLEPSSGKWVTLFIATHFFIQVLIPWRFLLYPGKLFWTEQGYRFSWRVMLMEKAGKAFFHVTDPATGRTGEAMAGDYLTPNQEKMMATQPDMILSYAHFLADKYREAGIANPEIRVECYVTLNGSGSRLFIDPAVDLSKEKDSFAHKPWILPFEKE